jgi:hypothetical protein
MSIRAALRASVSMREPPLVAPRPSLAVEEGRSSCPPGIDRDGQGAVELLSRHRSRCDMSIRAAPATSISIATEHSSCFPGIDLDRYRAFELLPGHRSRRRRSGRAAPRRQWARSWEAAPLHDVDREGRGGRAWCAGVDVARVVQVVPRVQGYPLGDLTGSTRPAASGDGRASLRCRSACPPKGAQCTPGAGRRGAGNGSKTWARPPERL